MVNTNATVRGASAAVTGARHLRMARNGQDAAAVWLGHGRSGAIVVCDGCGSAPSSEVGARLGAQLVIGSVARQLVAGARPTDPAMWARMRAEVVATLGALVEAMPRDREAAVHDHLLFTIVAAAVRDDEVAVWSIGDGAYAIGEHLRALGPFANNQPPYLAYDLLGAPQVAHLELATAQAGRVVVASDGVAELGLDRISLDRGLQHPDALRRQLAVLATSGTHIDWDAERVERSPAPLQDDGAIAVLAWDRGVDRETDRGAA